MSITSSTSSPKRYVYCSYCGQGFKRDEHLERHVLVHSNVRPFRCPECKVAFKRKDLLRRHFKTIHTPPNDDDDPKSEQTSETLINRIPIACLNCAQSKTKCDKQDPCSRCSKRDLPCERREFRRTRWKGNPQTGTVTPTREKTSEDESVQEEEDLDTQTISETSNTTGPTASSLPTSTEEPGTGMEIDISAATIPTVTTWRTQPSIVDIDMGPMLDQSMHLGEIDLDHSSTLTMPTTTESNGTEQYNTPTDPFQNLQYSADLREHYFGNTSMSMQIQSALSADDLAYAGWSPFQLGLPLIPNMYTHPTNTESFTLRRSWPLFRCNFGDTGSVANRTKDNIAKLQALDDPTAWSTYNAPPFANNLPDLPPIDPFVRDRMLAITQNVWQLAKARIFPSKGFDQHNADGFRWLEMITLLPRKDALTSLVTKYVQQSDDQLHLFPERRLFPSKDHLPRSENNLAAGILILLKLAQTMRSASSSQIRGFCAGFVEICYSLAEEAVQVTKETTQAGTTESLEISMGLLQSLCWSGDPWHMTIAMETWGRHAKVVEKAILSEYARGPDFSPEISLPTDSLNRMLHSWVAIDLEMSLFHDMPPKLDTASIALQLPAKENVAQNASLMSNGWESDSRPHSPPVALHMSLAELFETFMSGQLLLLRDIPATSLRLLLHPLQAMSMRLHQCLDAFGTFKTPGTRPVTTISLASMTLIDEYVALLAKWRQLAKLVSLRSAQGSPESLRSSLVLYYIMVLNSLTSFPKVEELTRSWTGSGTATPGPASQSWLRAASPDRVVHVMLNCGQCLHLLRTMPPMERPIWWSAALYRVALVLSQTVISINSISAVSMLRFGQGTEPTPPDSPHLLFLDQDIDLDADDCDPRFAHSLDKLHTRPVVTSVDGTAVVLENEISVLDHCLALLEHHRLFDGSDFASGIFEGLHEVRSRWDAQSPDKMAALYTQI